MDQVEHVAQDGRHFHQLAHVGGRNLPGASLNAHGHAHHQISDALEIGRRLQAGKQLAGAGLIYASDGCGQALIDLALDQIEFLFAIFDRKKRHARRIGEQVADVECGVAGDETGFQREIREIVGARGFGQR